MMCASLLTRLQLFVLHTYSTKDGVTTEIINATRCKTNAVSFFLVSLLVRKTTYVTSSKRDYNDDSSDDNTYFG